MELLQCRFQRHQCAVRETALKERYDWTLQRFCGLFNVSRKIAGGSILLYRLNVFGICKKTRIIDIHI